eukprot:g4127.t1
MQVQKLTEHAVMPVKGSPDSAGFDLSSAYDYEVPAAGKMLVKTDLAVKMPAGVYGRVAPRSVTAIRRRPNLKLETLNPFSTSKSGLALKKHIDVGAGVIDADYRGNVGPSVSMQVQKLTEHAVMPVKGSPDSAGFDLSSAYDYEIPAAGKMLVKTDLAVKMPPGVYGRVAPRSGLALKKHIDVGAGVIDADYLKEGNNPSSRTYSEFQNRANIFSSGRTTEAKMCGRECRAACGPAEAFKIEKGDRVAQLILEKYLNAEVQEVGSLDETDRGEGGFGSTGGSKELQK